MKLLHSFCVLTLGLVVQTTVAHTQPVQDPNFQTFTRSSFYSDLINRTLSSLPSDVFQRCPALASQGSQVSIIKPVTFAADGFPNGGLWKQAFPVSGCGNDTTLNFYFQATADEKIDTLVTAPGNTHTSTVLQGDALNYAKLAILAARENCTTLNIKNTKFESYGLVKPPMADPGVGQRRRPWWETWTLVGCGNTYDVPIDFVPNETGTQIIQQGGVIKR